MNQAVFERELDTHLTKLTEAYKILLKKSIIDDEGSTSKHDELMITTSAANIVFHSQALLDQINKVLIIIIIIIIVNINRKQ